jgi:choline dehydrogenase-like flavoprotein
MKFIEPPPANGFGDVGGGREYTADVCVVGAGPGGAACARQLAAAGLSVVILEEGPPSSRFRPNLGNAMRYHMQEGGAMVAQGSAPMPIAAGRGVGGGSLVNSAICFRTPDHILEGWVEVLGDERYSPAVMAPVFEELEALLGIGQVTEETAGANNKLIARGAEALGFPGGLLRRNTPFCQGCGLCNFGCPVNGKASVNFNLLPLAVRDGAVIQADVKVDRLLIEGDRVAGVSGVAHDPETRAPGGRVTVKAPRVVLSAGAVGTPRLLHYSGAASAVGPAVGEGLHVHPGNAVMGICDEVIELWKGATQGAFFEDPENLPGVLPHAFTAPPEATAVTMLPMLGGDMKEAFKLLPYLCGMVVMISDKSEGSVSAFPDGRANIRYTFGDKDVAWIKAGMVATARVLLAGGAKQVFGIVHGTGFCDTAEQLEAQLSDRTIRDFTLYAAHPMSTMRIGRTLGLDAQSESLRGLYVSDAGVFPTSLGVNPQLTTMAMGTVIGRGIVSAG